ncbi:unnamed protein product [Urochloa humidicola]
MAGGTSLQAGGQIRGGPSAASPCINGCSLHHQDAMPAAHVTVGQQVVNKHLDEEDAHATPVVSNGSSSSPSSSSKEPLTPEIQLEVAKELISQLLKAQEKRMLSAAEHSLIKSLEDWIPRLEAALGVCGGETQSLSKVASSCLARAKARHVIMAIFFAADQGRPVPFAPMVHSLSQQDAAPATHVAIGQHVVTRHLCEEDVHATSAVHNMSEANACRKHHDAKDLPSEHELLSSSLHSSSEEPLAPVNQLAVAKELITRFAMAQEKRLLSDNELSLVKFLLDRIPVLEAALGERSGQHSLRRGFMVAPPVQWAWPRRASIGRHAAPCHRPSSSEEPLTPEILLEIASEVITHLAMEQEWRMLSAGDLSLIKFLKDRIPDLEAVASGVRGGATPFPSDVAPSRSRARVKAARLAIAAILSPASANLLHPGLSAPMVHPLSHQDDTPSAHVTVGQQVVNKHLDEEDAHATPVVFNGSSSSPSSSSKEPLTPEIQLEVAKELISQLLKAQEKRMLSAAEHSLIKSLEDWIPRLEATLGVCGGETQSLSKVASSCLARAKARHVIMATFSAVDQGRPVPFVPMVYPLSQQDAKVARHSGEEDAHATSAVHKMSDANVSHEHHRGGQELSSEHESFSKKLNSACVPRVVTEKSSTTTAPEMAPPPSDGDNTAESSGVSNRWGMAPDVEGFDDFGLPDNLGFY